MGMEGEEKEMEEEMVGEEGLCISCDMSTQKSRSGHCCMSILSKVCSYS